VYPKNDFNFDLIEADYYFVTPSRNIDNFKFYIHRSKE